MAPKTPQFDKALDEILKLVEPGGKRCEHCSSDFHITEEDVIFFKKLRVPPPSSCPECRLQHCMAFRMSFVPIFYKKTCGAPGHREKIVAFYSDENPVTVYDDKFYQSDGWEGLEFGRNYQIREPFFDQFKTFLPTVPRQALFKDPKGVNSDYVVAGVSPKNAYYVAVPYYCENVYYSHLPNHTRDSIDVEEIDYSEQCYDCSRLVRCFNCYYSEDSEECINGYFLFDCHNCQNCFGCTNLRNKSYCFFNEQLTKNEYDDRLKKINLGKRSTIKEYREKFEEMKKNAIHKNIQNIKVENSLGDMLENCKNCQLAFKVFDSENVRHTVHADSIYESMDLFGATRASFSFYSTGIADCERVKFTIMCRTNNDLEYCIECDNCQYCFACVGLKNKKFCIMNKQFSEVEYWKMVDEIKAEMLKRGEYGKFFPIEMSSLPYNDSNAIYDFPLKKEEVLSREWHWQDKTENRSDLAGIQPIKTDEIPDDINDVDDGIKNKAVICEKTNRPFRITDFELRFYRAKKIPLPTIHPEERIKGRVLNKHPYKLWYYPCSNCGKEMPTIYDPVRKLKVYCEQCYQNEVI